LQKRIDTTLPKPDKRGPYMRSWTKLTKPTLDLKDVYSLYESGKSRRYGLLFSVNGGAFAILSLLVKDTDKAVDARWAALPIAVAMLSFTAIMIWDIHNFGEKMAALGGPLNLYKRGGPGRQVLWLLGILLILAWIAVAAVALWKLLSN
jgi:hypothetical protein